MSSTTVANHEDLRCGRCRTVLRAGLDKQKHKDRYWRNCYACREKHTRKSRQRREILASSDFRLPTSSLGSLAHHKSPTTVTDAQRLSREDSVDTVVDTSTVRENNSEDLSDNDEDFMSILKDLNRKSFGIDAKRSDGPSVTPPNPECSVCSDTFAVDHFSQLPDCSHEPRVGATSWDRILCPSNGCGVLVSHEAMKSLATEETYARQVNYLTGLLIPSTDQAYVDFRHCLRSGCNSGQIHDSGVEGNIFRCVACDFLVCTTHDEAFHTGETCEEYDRKKSCQRKVEDDASMDKIDSTTKECPNPKCGVRIEKNDGCDHMTCRRCNHEFCWVCFAPYTGSGGIWRTGNHVHQHDCPHWREPRSERIVDQDEMEEVDPEDYSDFDLMAAGQSKHVLLRRPNVNQLRKCTRPRRPALLQRQQAGRLWDVHCTAECSVLDPATQQVPSVIPTQSGVTVDPDHSATKSYLRKREFDSLGIVPEPKTGARTERRLQRQPACAEAAAQNMALRHADEAQAALRVEEAVEEVTESSEKQTLTCVACADDYPAQDSIRFGTSENPSGHRRAWKHRVCLTRSLCRRVSKPISQAWAST
ncbi:hypothetical protein DE146DRAFT_773436 [Phaeosphaeria sp. MPI-PUGE-AT-0046c]|nr:hypothetical protein DE146DRAFT_773436 [Phaeosphaeria sp. MPI-PUGE-AT-0046c]